MIQFLKTAITRGPDPLRTQPASFCTVWPRKTLSTPRVELVRESTENTLVVIGFFCFTPLPVVSG